jgi:prepilin-type N-terminal cleavage/methylation domain-containing protein
MRNLKNSKGFTLIELMIVVVIIGILAAIAIPRFASVSQGAKEAEAEPILKQIKSLEDSEFLRENAYVTGDNAALLANLDGWEDPDAEYYTFSVSAANCAIATPVDATEVDPRSMDLATGELYTSDDCS